MINIWIFEDKAEFYNKLKDIIGLYSEKSEFFSLEKVKVFEANYLNEIDNIKENYLHERNLYIVDVDLSESYNGFDLAKRVREFDHRGNILFITSHIEMMSDVFLYNLKVLSYIYKLDPDLKARIFSAFDQIENELLISDLNEPNSASEMLIFSENKVHYKLPLNDIIALETNPINRKLKIVTDNRSYEYRATLKDVLKKLPSNFMKSHRSIVLNTSMIREIKIVNSYYQALMENGDIYNISRSYVKDILSIFSEK